MERATYLVMELVLDPILAPLCVALSGYFSSNSAPSSALAERRRRSNGARMKHACSPPRQLQGPDAVLLFIRGAPSKAVHEKFFCSQDILAYIDIGCPTTAVLLWNAYSSILDDTRIFPGLCASFRGQLAPLKGLGGTIYAVSTSQRLGNEVTASLRGMKFSVSCPFQGFTNLLKRVRTVPALKRRLAASLSIAASSLHRAPGSVPRIPKK